MPKKNKTTEDYLHSIELMLAGIILKKETDVKTVARIIGCHTNVISKLYPDRKSKVGHKK